MTACESIILDTLYTAGNDRVTAAENKFVCRCFYYGIGYSPSTRCRTNRIRGADAILSRCSILRERNDRMTLETFSPAVLKEIDRILKQGNTVELKRINGKLVVVEIKRHKKIEVAIIG